MIKPTWLLGAVRLLRLLFHFTYGVIGVGTLMDGRRADLTSRQRRFRTRWLQGIARALGVRVEIIGQRPDSALPVLWVSNHISWLDIAVLTHVSDGTFLSKEEVKYWPLVGWLADRSGTLFIARGQRGAAGSAREEMRRVLERGGDVLIFPEGTTTDGHGVKRMISYLFQVTSDVPSRVQPVALRYPHAEGVHPAVPYIGEMGLMESIKRVLGAESIVAQIHLLPLIESTEGARRCAQAAEASIRSVVEQRGIAEQTKE